MALDVPQEYTRPQEDASQLLVEALRRKDPERIREVRELAHRAPKMAREAAAPAQ